MKNVLLYLSAFIPMYILILIKQLVELICGSLKINVLSIIVFVFLIMLIMLGLIGLRLEIFNKKQKSDKVTIISKENITDQHFLGYFSLFVLFAITFNLTRLSMFIVFVVILVMIGVVYVKNKLFYINPFLNIMGYNFYNITYKIVNNETSQSTRIFFKGDLVINKEYFVKIKDENFSFIDRTKKK